MGHGTWSLTLRDTQTECTGAEENVWTQEAGGKLRNEELYNLYSLAHIIHEVHSAL